MRKGAILLAMLASFLALLSIFSTAIFSPAMAQINRCEALATEMERMPCYYARAAAASQPAYVYRHSVRKHVGIARHRKRAVFRRE
jgi:hypothetical protein